MRRIISFILAVLTVLCLASCTKKEEGEIQTPQNPYKPEDIVMKTENFSYTRGELSIIFYQYCNEFFYDSETVDFYNVEPAVSLKDQMYGDETWFDYFLNISKDHMKNVLLLCEGAKAAGIELSEEDLAEVEKAIVDVDRYITSYDYNEQEYFAMKFGVDSSRDALREYLKKEALATRYENSIISAYEFTDDELLAYAKEHSEEFNTINYISYTFDEDTNKNAKAAAAELAKITDPAEFDSHIVSYMTDVLMLSGDQVSTADCYKTSKYYDKYSDFSKWAFDGAAAGTTYIKSNDVDGEYTVYLLTKEVGIREDITKNIRVVLIDIDSHETDAKAKSHAEELLEGWKAGEATEESFITLVKEHTDDDAALYDEGLIEGVAIDSTLPEGFVEWMWNEETAVGDTGIFKDSGSYFIVYNCGDGELKWKLDAKAGLISDGYSDNVSNLEAKFKVQQFDEVLASLEA